MEKILELKIYNGRGVESTPFPNSDNPIEIGAFRYDAKRMGGAPTITASVNYPTCLDDEWTDKVYALFNGEKYFLKQTPTSSYDNTDVMYKHDIELVSERAVLDNVYFFDVVTGDPMDSDKPVSNSTKVTFVGDIREFARRMNASLEYSKLLKWEDGVDEEGNAIKVANGYNIVVDNDEAITTEKKLMSFEDQFFSNVLQAIYNTYEVPYYFDGKTIHIGFANQDVVIPDLSYGVDNALLSVTKSNANYKTVNRATGYGSTDNIPFYYPNDSPKGEIVLSAQGTLSVDDIKIFDKDAFGFSDLHVNRLYTYRGDTSQNNCSTKVNVPAKGESVDMVEDDATIKKLYIENNIEDIVVEYDLSLGTDSVADIKLKWQLSNFPTPILNMTPPLKNAYAKDHLELEIAKVVSIHNGEERDIDFTATTEKLEYYSYIHSASGQTDSGRVAYKFRQTGISFSVDTQYGQTKVLVYAKLKTIGNFWDCVPDYFWGTSKKKPYCDVSFSSESSIKSVGGWQDSDGNKFNMKDCGITFLKNPSYGDSFSYSIAKNVKTSKNLMPSVYRQSDAKERFYNAVNYPFPFVEGYELKYGEYEKDGEVHNDAYKDDEGNYIRFDHPYVEGKAREHIVAVEDIKPTIKDTVNAMGLRMDMFSEFAYDDDDNDETIENEEGSDRDYVHSYFFGKLRKLDFNLFDCAIEQQPMTISFTSGACGACNFEIGVTEEFPQKNPVQVDSEGNLVRRNGRVVCGQFEPIYENELQPEQQDTINNEVWIALKKEDQAYGELMPKAPVDGVGGHRPKAARNDDGTPNNEGDTFVILGIHLPDSYIDNAERKLEKEIIKYIKDNNEEKFTFSIGFSRIYFAENETILENLSENSKVRIFYNNLPYDLYVSSFSYNLNAGDVLPDIKIELDETLKVSQNPIQKAVNQVKSELGKVLGNIDVIGAATPYFIRKDADDEARGTIDFKKGVKFGEGGKVEILDNNSAKLTIEYLEVTKKASFTSLEIQEKTHVGGQILVTPAAINCGEVEEIDNAYRCYFQTKGEDGDEIFNQFALGDQAICQTFNTWGSRYYWRKVVGVGEDYIDLSNVEGEYDEDSDAPMAGDKIIQLGNQSDTTRQNAIVIAAYGDGSPYIIQYKGINAFEIPDDKIVTKLSSTENIFTGKVHMELGSDGLETLPEWLDVKGIATNAQEAANKAQSTADEALEKVDAIGENTFAELEAYINEVKESLQGQIDGAIDSYFYEYAPTSSNYPASDWDTDAEKEAHLNDTFTNLKDGRSWRWSRDANNNYSWVEITDTATSEALALAGKAQETADGKMTVFLSRPTPPYKAGDLWAGGEDAPLKRCIRTKESGTYEASDWALADNAQAYADAIKSELELSVQNTKSTLDKAIEDAEKASKNYTDEAKTAINKSIATLEQAKANVTDVYDKTTVDGKITAAEQNANTKAQELATAAQELAETNVKAWADGEIDAAEKEAIAKAEEKVNAAKNELDNAIDALEKDLEAQIDIAISSLNSSIETAKTESKSYTDSAKSDIEARISQVEQAKADIEDVYDKATADGKISDAEKKAISSANAYANAQSDYLDRTLRAWADGEIDDAEARAIAEAESKVNAAKEEMERYTDEMVNGMKIGGENLLRNSGFTGDYLSEQLADEKVLEGAAELYSSPLDHWTTTSSTVLDSTETISGKVANISSEGISQTLYYKTSIGEDYVLSFKAKGRGNLTYTVGDASGSVALTTTMTFYEVVVTPTISSDTFIIKDANCTIGDLKLEKGNKATSWSASPLDNASDRAYYQSMKYIQNAFEGATDVFGGLVLTEQIQVGDYDPENKKWVKMSGGMSGVYESGHDVAFWAGGNFEQAIATVMKYVENPNYQPTEEELSSMVQFVVTHGGRAILNEAIVRGDIYANNGRFRGVVEALSGVFNNVDVQSGKIANFDINGSSLGIQEEVGGNGMSLYDKYISFYENNTQENTELLARIGAYEGLDTYQHVAEFENKSTNILDSMGGTGFGVCSDVSGYTNSYAFASKKGVFAGFRPHVAILGSSNDSPLELGKYHHTVLALYGGTIVLDGTPENGQEYEIICPNTSVTWGQVQIITYDGKDNIYLMLDGIKRKGFSVRELGGTRQVVKLVYFDKDKTWFCWHHTY